MLSISCHSLYGNLIFICFFFSNTIRSQIFSYSQCNMQRDKTESKSQLKVATFNTMMNWFELI